MVRQNLHRIQVTEIPIENIIVMNPMSRLDLGKDFNEFVKNIEYLGLLHPITVKKIDSVPSNPNSYELLSGRRRFEACRALGWKEIPATVIQRPLNEHCLPVNGETIGS